MIDSGFSYPEIPDNCRRRQELRHRALSSGDDPGCRISGKIAPRHAVPPMGHGPAERVSGEGLHHGRRAAKEPTRPRCARLLLPRAFTPFRGAAGISPGHLCRGDRPFTPSDNLQFSICNFQFSIYNYQFAISPPPIPNPKYQIPPPLSDNLQFTITNLQSLPLSPCPLAAGRYSRETRHESLRDPRNRFTTLYA